jgi:hypothetical protein
MDTKGKIEKFVEDIVIRRDYPLLDILWTFSYSVIQTSKSGSKKRNKIELFKELFMEWIQEICVRNLELKYNLQRERIFEKWNKFQDFLNDKPDFLSYDKYDEDAILLREILTEKSSIIWITDMKNRIKDLSGIPKEIITFVPNYISLQIEESEKQRQQYGGSGTIYYLPLKGFHADSTRFRIHTDKNEKIIYHEINAQEGAYIFSNYYDRELKKHKFKVKYYKNYPGIIPSFNRYKTFIFYQFGDELSKLGIGYWILYMTANEEPKINLIVPHFLYENLEEFQEKYPKPVNFEIKIKDIIKKKPWNLKE